VAVIPRLKVMAHMDIAERRSPQDGRINLQTQSASDRRPCVDDPDRETARAYRSSDDRARRSNSVLDRLDVTEEQLGIVKMLLARPGRDRLADGPETGSGKSSTTLYSFLTLHQLGHSACYYDRRAGGVSYRPVVSQIDVKPEISPDVRERAASDFASGSQRGDGRGKLRGL